MDGSAEGEPVSGNEDNVVLDGERGSEVGGVVFDVLEATEEEYWDWEEGAGLDVVGVLWVEEYELELDDRSIEANVDDLVEGEGELVETGSPGSMVCDTTLLDVLGMIGVLVGEDSGKPATCEVVAGTGMVSGG